MIAKLKIVERAQTRKALKSSFTPGFSTRSDGETLKYIEDKPFDMQRVTTHLAASESSNHWANFGPASQKIETEIAARLKLDDSLRVVMCASGTAALHGIIAVHETLAGKDLRWVTSSFGYYSAIQGPLSKAEIVDCDENALLNLDLLDPNEFDGFIVTNTFGQSDAMEEYHRYAAAHGKIMCVDAAMAFGSHLHGANECISFHHTKPWGFGEGGCAIVAVEHEALLRSLICFGHQPGSAINRRASNGKISDVACAFAHTRLEQMDSLGPQYRAQYRRIARIGLDVGLNILANVADHPGVPASVPFLAPAPLANFKHSVLPTGRYYHPLDDTAVAHGLYERIVNVACHPGIASLNDQQIKDALQSIIDRCN